MWQNVYRQSPDGDKEMFLNIMLAVYRILDKLRIFSNTGRMPGSRPKAYFGLRP